MQTTFERLVACGGAGVQPAFPIGSDRTPCRDQIEPHAPVNALDRDLWQAGGPQLPINECNTHNDACCVYCNALDMRQGLLT